MIGEDWSIKLPDNAKASGLQQQRLASRLRAQALDQARF